MARYLEWHTLHLWASRVRQIAGAAVFGVVLAVLAAVAAHGGF